MRFSLNNYFPAFQHILLSYFQMMGVVLSSGNMQQSLTDITGENDVKTLVDSFYNKVNADELLSPIFNDFAHTNWELHMPTMYSFWSSILFRTATYQGRPWPKHSILPVNAAHFSRWLSLFKQTVDEHFTGPKAIEAKNAAASIADTFQNRMQILRGNGPGKINLL